MSAKLVDITGKKFGMLTVTYNIVGRDKFNRILCQCKCDCGTTVIILRNKLLSGERTSCGCTKQEKEFTNIELANQTIRHYINGLRDGTINGKIGGTKYVK